MLSHGSGTGVVVDDELDEVPDELEDEVPDDDGMGVVVGVGR